MRRGNEHGMTKHGAPTSWTMDAHSAPAASRRKATATNKPGTAAASSASITGRYPCAARWPRTPATPRCKDNTAADSASDGARRRRRSVVGMVLQAWAREARARRAIAPAAAARARTARETAVGTAATAFPAAVRVFDARASRPAVAAEMRWPVGAHVGVGARLGGSGGGACVDKPHRDAKDARLGSAGSVGSVGSVGSTAGGRVADTGRRRAPET